MNPNLFRKLKKWRDKTAEKEMIEIFRVLPNRTIEDIVRMEPKTREELTNIKGIKDKKYYKYGREILNIVKESLDNKINDKQLFSKETALPLSSIQNISTKDNPNTLYNILQKNATTSSSNTTNQKEKIYSVSEFLDYLNEKLITKEVKLKGEVTSIDEREKVVYFNLKDEKDESVINCLIFKYQYEISGVKLETGNEIIVNGYSEIYKPTGRISFKANLIEVAGEGALKKAYDNLKRELEQEGLFSEERKKKLPELPETIGLITSSKGAAIGDFMANLGNYGFKIKFINSSVEGKQAVFDLISAIKIFKKMIGIDILVIIRGGGSFESLQAFNNEALVREISSLKIPVVCGVGHEKDISLVSLASDLAVSTPTATAKIICKSWDMAIEEINRSELTIVNLFEKYLYKSEYEIDKLSLNLNHKFEDVLQKFFDVKNSFLNIFENIGFIIDNTERMVNSFSSQILISYSRKITDTKNKISFFENIINLNNPKKQLRLGYSIVSLDGKIVRSIKQVKKDCIINIKIFDGEIKAKIKDIKK